MEIPDRRLHNPRSVAAVDEIALSPLPRKPRPDLLPMSNKVFRLERDGNVLIVIPQGDASGFRYHDVHQESNTTLEVLDDPSLAHVVVDFTSEQMLGSIIISVVIKVCRKAGGKGGKAAFCNASPDMLEVLQTMNLTRLWTHYPSRGEAIVAVRAA